MRIIRLVAAVFALTCIGSIGLAQQVPPPQQTMPPVEAVITHIPADALGFVVVNGVDNIFQKIEDFYNDIGAPGGPMPPIRELIVPAMGPSFNPNGGFAIVMLDPEKFGVDLVKVLSQAMTPDYGYYEDEYDEEYDEEEETAVEEVEEQPPIPYVFFIPGQGPESVMPPGSFEVSWEGDYTVFTESWSGDVLYAIQEGGYVLLSPNSDALDAIRSAEVFFEDGSSGNAHTAIADSDVGAYVNMQLAGPLAKGLFELMQTSPMGQMMMPGLEELNSQVMDVAWESLEELDSVSAAYTFTETGLKLQQTTAFVEGSVAAKQVAAMTGYDKPLMDMLPNLPYGVAGGVHCAMNEEMRAQEIAQLTKLLNVPQVKEILGDNVDRILSIAEEMYSELMDIQFVVGGAPEGAGTIAAAVVFRTKDAQGALGRLPGDLPLLEQAINALIEKVDSGEEGLLTITVTENAEMVDGLAVTHIVMDHPEFEEESEEDQAKAQAVLGMTKPTFLAAAPDDQTLIITFGGGSAMMSDTIAAARDGGTIVDSEGVAEVMAELPADPYVVTMVSLGNIGLIGANTTQVIEPDSEFVDWPLADMENTKPIVMAAAADGAVIHTVMFAPTDVIADTVASVMAWTQAQQEQWQQDYGPGPGYDDEDGATEPEDPGF